MAFGGAMKVLTMCQGGNVRSVALGYLLKYFGGHDAVACSWEKNSPQTILMLCQWADKICVLQEEFKVYIPKRFWRRKLVVVDVGPDRWGNSLHPELVMILAQKVDGVEGLRVGAA